MNLTLAAASSNARSIPASRQQSCATAAAFSSVILKSGETARARSRKSRPEGARRTCSSVGLRVVGGSARGGTGNSRSPLRRRGARLVVSTVSPGQPSTSDASQGAASSRCSRLSSTRSRRRSRRCSSRASSGLAWLVSLIPRTLAMVGRTRVGSPTDASPTNAAPSGETPDASAARAASTARRVFPTPPTPVSVSNRTCGSPRRSTTSATSRSRPTSGVAGLGRNEGRTGAGAASAADSVAPRRRAWGRTPAARPGRPRPGRGRRRGPSRCAGRGACAARAPARPPRSARAPPSRPALPA